jgi:hypothetical protein
MISVLSNAQKKDNELFTTPFLKSSNNINYHNSDILNDQARFGQMSLFRLDSMITRFTEEDDTTGQLFLDFKRRYIYDSLYRTVTNIYSGWDDSLNTWENEEKEEMLYDANSMLIQTSYFEWDTDLETWADTDYKNEFTYDSEGKLIQDISYSYEDSVWFNAEKKEYSYDANNNNIQELNFYGSNIGWDSSYKKVMNYDLNNNEIESVSSQYNNDWVNTNKQEHDYNSNNNVIEYRNFEWNLDDSSWSISHQKISYSYDQNNNLNEEINYYLNEDSTFENNSKTEYVFDANNNLNEEIYYVWEEDDSIWIGTDKTVLNYNTSYSFEDLILPFTDNQSLSYFSNMLNTFEAYSFDENSNSWYLNEQLSLHYNEQNTTNLKNLRSETIEVYPNPTSNWVNFSFEIDPKNSLFELFDVNGRRVLAKTISSKNPVDLTLLNEGIYIYNLHLNGEIKSGKLIKK